MLRVFSSWRTSIHQRSVIRCTASRAWRVQHMAGASRLRLSRSLRFRGSFCFSWPCQDNIQHRTNSKSWLLQICECQGFNMHPLYGLWVAVGRWNLEMKATFLAWHSGVEFSLHVVRGLSRCVSSFGAHK